jgi:hypothetical protein
MTLPPIPAETFLESSFQRMRGRDSEYLAKFLPEAKALIERSMEAILAEYGHSAKKSLVRRLKSVLMFRFLSSTWTTQ